MQFLFLYLVQTGTVMHRLNLLPGRHLAAAFASVMPEQKTAITRRTEIVIMLRFDIFRAPELIPRLSVVWTSHARPFSEVPFFRSSASEKAAGPNKISSSGAFRKSPEEAKAVW